MFDIIKFCNQYKIEYSASGTQISTEWIGLNCPFCGKDNFGLGFHLQSGALTCWRCGKHSHTDLIRKYLSCDLKIALQLKDLFETRSLTHYNLEQVKRIKAKSCFLPNESRDLLSIERAINYLIERRFDPQKLERLWELKATNNLGNYKFRIIAPIILNGKTVSYQGRDYTGKSDLKYKACQSENEVIDHQHIAYGMDYIVNDEAVLVEGITDVWRLGPGAICLFGISYTLEQINMLSKRLKTVYVLFDSEKQAQEQGNKVGTLLAARGVNVTMLELDEGDPGEMNQRDANNLMKDIFGQRRY